MKRSTGKISLACRQDRQAYTKEEYVSYTEYHPAIKNINNTQMKTFLQYIKYTPLLFMMALCSCGRFLDEKIYSQQYPDNFYTNPSEAEGAILGVINTYSGNANYNLLNMEEYTTNNVVIDAARILKTDDNLQFSRKDVRVSNNIVQNVYTNLYKGIYNCNSLIYYMEQAKWADEQEAQRSQFIVEAYTLRAMAYFKLVRLYGRVPLIVDIKDNTPQGPLTIGRTPVADIYTQIVNDLKTAKSLFIQEGARAPGFASKIMARLLLSEVYLTMNGEPLKSGPQYLEAARAEADTLIHAKAPGITVPELVNFYELFCVTNENRGEIIFSGQNYGPGTGQIFGASGWSYGALSHDIIRAFDVSGPIDMSNPNRELRNVNPNTDAYDITQYTDPNKFIDGRFYPTFWPYKSGVNQTTGVLANYYDVLNYGANPATYSTNINRTVFPGKYRSDYEYKAGPGAAYPHYDKQGNIIMYRWTEAFLIYAEADNELNGPQPEAIAAVNKIRHRAALIDLSADQTDTKEHFRDAIRREWRLEFVDEGKHFYNLQRWGTLIDEVNAFVNEFNSYNPTIPMSLLQKGKNELYPIPFIEIDRTHFEQNPGY